MHNLLGGISAGSILLGGGDSTDNARGCIVGREGTPIGVLYPFASPRIVKSCCSYELAQCNIVLINNIPPTSTSVKLFKIVVPVFEIEGAIELVENHTSITQLKTLMLSAMMRSKLLSVGILHL